MDQALTDLGEYLSGALANLGAKAEVALGELMISVGPPALLRLLAFLRDDSQCTFKELVDLCGVDYPSREKRFEVVYNLWSYSRNKPLGVKVRVPRADATVPSVTGLWIGANWLEREEWDLMGIKFDGHPNLKRMFLPDSWKGHPLRKDYDLKKEQYVALNDDGEDVVYSEPREGAW